VQEESSSAPHHHPGIAESDPFGRMLLATAKWFAFTGGVIFGFMPTLPVLRVPIDIPMFIAGGDGNKLLEAAKALLNQYDK